MSITNFSNKIKSKLGIDIYTVLLLSVILWVGLSAFGLGILYSKDRYVSDGIDKGKDEILIIDNNNSDKEIKENRIYVASKNGKLYYNINCSGANRIKEENKVWFSSFEEAEKSGYTLASSCK